MTLNEMAAEYLHNVALLELRMAELKTAQKQATQAEVRYRLKRRVGCLRELINDGRKAAFTLSHYYDRGGEHNGLQQAV